MPRDVEAVRQGARDRARRDRRYGVGAPRPDTLGVHLEPFARRLHERAIAPRPPRAAPSPWHLRENAVLPSRRTPVDPRCARAIAPDDSPKIASGPSARSNAGTGDRHHGPRARPAVRLGRRSDASPRCAARPEAAPYFAAFSRVEQGRVIRSGSTSASPDATGRTATFRNRRCLQLKAIEELCISTALVEGRRILEANDRRDVLHDAAHALGSSSGRSSSRISLGSSIASSTSRYHGRSIGCGLVRRRRQLAEPLLLVEGAEPVHDVARGRPPPPWRMGGALPQAATPHEDTDRDRDGNRADRRRAAAHDQDRRRRRHGGERHPVEVHRGCAIPIHEEDDENTPNTYGSLPPATFPAAISAARGNEAGTPIAAIGPRRLPANAPTSSATAPRPA